MPRAARVVRYQNGTTAVICGYTPNAQLCSVCGHQGTKLCDGPGEKPGKTCDKPLCVKCAAPGGNNIDYCPDHAPAQEKLF